MVVLKLQLSIYARPAEGKKFDLYVVKWIRIRKLQWIEHILRMDKDNNNIVVDYIRNAMS